MLHAFPKLAPFHPGQSQPMYPLVIFQTKVIGPQKYLVHLAEIYSGSLYDWNHFILALYLSFYD